MHKKGGGKERGEGRGECMTIDMISLKIIVLHMHLRLLLTIAKNRESEFAACSQLKLFYEI